MRLWFRDAFACLFFFLVLIGGTVYGAMSSGYTWQWERALPYFFTPNPGGVIPFTLGNLLASGLATTCLISAVGLVIALGAGLLTAFLRLSGGPVSRGVATLYIGLIRNTPLMVQLLVLYLLVPASWNLSALAIACLALGLFEGAYLAEIFRAGILAIPAGQWEAAQSLGLPVSTCWTAVILPQAIRRVLPPTLGQCVSLIKDSSLASVIAVSELAQQSGLVVSDTFLSFEIWLLTAGVYLCLALLLSACAAWLGCKLQRRC